MRIEAAWFTESYNVHNWLDYQTRPQGNTPWNTRIPRELAIEARHPRPATVLDLRLIGRIRESRRSNLGCPHTGGSPLINCG